MAYLVCLAINSVYFTVTEKERRREDKMHAK